MLAVVAAARAWASAAPDLARSCVQLGGRESVSSDGHGSSYFSGERTGAPGAAGAGEPGSKGASAADERTVTLMEPVYPSGSLSRAASGALAGSSAGSGLGLGALPPPEQPPRADAAACPLRHVDSLGTSPEGASCRSGACVAGPGPPPQAAG